MEIQDLVIKGYDFSALLAEFELPDDDRAYLAVLPDELIEIEGSFTIRWDGDTPLVSIDAIYAWNGGRSVDVTDNAIIEEFERIIDARGNDTRWMEDRMLSEDYYTD